MAGRCKEGVMGGRQVPSGGQVIGRSAELYSNGPPESQSVTGRGQVSAIQLYCMGVGGWYPRWPDSSQRQPPRVSRAR